MRAAGLIPPDLRTIFAPLIPDRVGASRNLSSDGITVGLVVHEPDGRGEEIETRVLPRGAALGDAEGFCILNVGRHQGAKTRIGLMKRRHPILDRLPL